MNYDGEIVIGTAVDTSGIKAGVDDVGNLLSNGEVFKRIGKDDLGNALVEGISVAIKENAYEMVDKMEKAITELDYKKQMNLVSEEEYYRELETIRDEYLQKGSENWWKYTAEIVEYEQNVVEEQKKNIEKLTDLITKNIEDKFDDVAQNADSIIKSSIADYERQMKSLENKKDTLSKKLASYGGLYGTAVFNTGEERSYIENGVWKKDTGALTLIDVTDLKNEISLLEKYRQALEGLSQNENITQDFFDSFTKLGLEDGIKVANSVLSLGTDDIKSYMELWSEKQKISDEISSSLYENEENQIAETLKEKLKEAFGTVDETFMSDSGLKWATSFGESFKNKISEMMEQVKGIISQKISDIEYSISLEKESKGSNTLVYNLYGSGETVADQLKSARANSELERLRGGY